MPTTGDGKTDLNFIRSKMTGTPQTIAATFNEIVDVSEQIMQDEEQSLA